MDWIPKIQVQGKTKQDRTTQVQVILTSLPGQNLKVKKYSMAIYPYSTQNLTYPPSGFSLPVLRILNNHSPSWSLRAIDTTGK